MENNYPSFMDQLYHDMSMNPRRYLHVTDPTRTANLLQTIEKEEPSYYERYRQRMAEKEAESIAAAKKREELRLEAERIKRRENPLNYIWPSNIVYGIAQVFKNISKKSDK